MAQKWAETLASKDAMQHSTGGNYGENLFAQFYCGSPLQVSGGKPVDSWYSEIKDYQFGSGFNMKTGE